MTAAVERHTAVLARDGWCVVSRALAPAMIASIEAALQPRFAKTPLCEGAFYGAHTRRFGSLLARSAGAEHLVMHPLVLAITEQMLLPWCERIALNLTQAIEIHPGALPQLPHRDQDMWGGPKGSMEYLVNVMWPLTSFRPENGGTRLWSGSHLDQDLQLLPEEDAIAPLVLPGDALIFLGSTLHGGGGNVSTSPRRGIVISYCLGWLKPFELQWLVYLALAPSDYADLLRGAGRKGVDLLEQSPDGFLMLGSAGEQLVQSRDFYAVFATDEEWRLVSGGRTLGTVPVTNVLGIGSLVAFAGRRWRVEAVDDRGKVLDVVPHRSGKLPRFDRLANEPLDDRLTAVMREVLSDSEVPPYLDAVGREFLQQGRTAYRVLSLASSKLVPAARDTHVMTWRGTAVNSVLSVALMGAGLEVEVHDVGVTVVDSSPGQLAAILRELTECPPIEELADFVAGLRSAKLDDFVDEHLLRRLWVQRNARHRTAVSQVLWELQAARPLPSDL